MVKKIQKVTVSRQRRKQRKKMHNACAEERAVMMSVRLSKDLRKKYGGIRTMPVKVGDQVEIMTGLYKNRKGKVKRVQRRKYRIFVEKIAHENSRGQQKEYPIHPSNCVIQKLNLEHNRKKQIAKKIKKKRGVDLKKKIKEEDLMKDDEDEVDLENKDKKEDLVKVDEKENDGDDSDDDMPDLESVKN